MLIVGSNALIREIGPVRKPMDIDMFASKAEVMDFLTKTRRTIEKEEFSQDHWILHTDKGVIEVELTDDSELITNLHDKMLLDSHDNLHATLDWLYFLKMSHRYKKDSHHFMKTMTDIHLMRKAGAVMPHGTEEIFKAREKATYTNKLPALNVPKEDFFKKTEDFYVYDHDSIHVAVAMMDEPAYTHYMATGEQVMTSKDAFYAVDEQVRLYGVLEESYVLALERSLIPSGFRAPPHAAFNMALEKVCTSITGGWFREYAWENYFTVQQLYNPNFVGKFKTALNDGIIQPFQR